MKTVKMKCKSCNGTLEMDESKSVIFCPYCGAKDLIIEDNEVKIAKIESDNRKDVEIHESDNKVKMQWNAMKTDVVIYIAGLLLIAIMCSMLS